MAAALCLPALTAHGQGLLARATQRVASLSADIALSRAVVVDLSAAGGATTPFGALQAGVSSVDLVNGVVVRVHLFLLNTGDTAITQPVPADSAYVLVDASGRRFPRISVRLREAKSTGILTIPALERALVDVVFSLDKSATGDAALKVGAGTVIRGIPLRQGGEATPAPAATAPPAAPTPPDTAIPPR